MTAPEAQPKVVPARSERATLYRFMPGDDRRRSRGEARRAWCWYAVPDFVLRVIVDRLSKTSRDRNGREVAALEDIAPKVEPDEFVAVLGPVEFGLEELDGAPRERKARAARFIAMTGLEGFEGKYPHQLSGSRLLVTDIERQMQWWTTNGFMKRTIPLKGIVDTSFVEEAARAVPER